MVYCLLDSKDINPNDESNTEVDNPDQRIADESWPNSFGVEHLRALRLRKEGAQSSSQSFSC